MDIFLKCEKFTTVSDIKKLGVYPYFHALESRQDIEVVMEGKRRIMLGSNNYLGLTTNPDVVEAGLDAIKEFGTGCSGSRFLNGTLELHIQLEKDLARFLRKEAALTFSTGFQSNLGIISALVSRHDYVVCDFENHASIYDACRLSFGTMLRYKHNDMDDLKKVLNTIPCDSGILIVTDGVFSMGGDIADLPSIVKLAKEFGARVMVDDAHGLGVIGEGGRGTASYFDLEDEVDIYMGTFSKSLASLGGYMVAGEHVVDFVKHTSRPFIFSASITPVSCAVASAALNYLSGHPEIVDNLRDVSKYAHDGLMERKVEIKETKTPIIPIYTHDMMNTLKMSKELYEAGVYVNPVLPPATPPTECLLRTSYMATHNTRVLDEAMDIIAEVINGGKHG